MNANAYYRHSGRWTPKPVALGVAAGVAAAIPLAYAYAYASLYIPLVGTVTFLLTAGYVFGIGAAVAHFLHEGKVRNRAVGAAAGALVGLFALWFSWVVWVTAVMGRADVDVPVLGLALRPAALFDAIGRINEVGAWSLKGATPTGGILWAIWAIEAAIVVGGTALMGYGAVDDPFCETCDVWCTPRAGFRVAGPADKAIAPRLEVFDYAALSELPEPSPQAYTRIDLHQCVRCEKTATLSAVGVTLNKKGEKQEKTLVRHLLLPPEQMRALVAAMPDAG